MPNTPQATVERVSPLDLTFADTVAWRRFLEAQPSLSSPFLTPEWAQAVARHRPDAEVVIFRKGARAVGFLPVQRPNAFSARPIGGAVNDCQALVGPVEPSFDLAEAARVLDVQRIDFTSALRESGLGRMLQTSDAAPVASFADGWSAYVQERRQAGSSALSAAAQALRKLSEAHGGDVSVEAFSSDAEAFDQLIGWVRADALRSGAVDLLAQDWTQRVVQDTFRTPRSSTFGGALFVLRVQSRPVAALYALTARHVAHGWICGHDPAFEAFAPQQCLLVGAMKAIAKAGFLDLQFGPAVQAGAAGLSNHERAIGAAFLAPPGVAAAVRSAEYGLRALVESLPVGPWRQWPARAMRRMDAAAGLRPVALPRPDRAA